MVEVNSVVEPVLHLVHSEYVHVVDDPRLAIIGLNDDLLPVWFKVHIKHETAVEEVNVVNLREDVV